MVLAEPEAELDKGLAGMMPTLFDSHHGAVLVGPELRKIADPGGKAENRASTAARVAPSSAPFLGFGGTRYGCSSSKLKRKSTAKAIPTA